MPFPYSSSTFNDNGNSVGSSGLYVSSNGNITLESVTGDGNGLVGHLYYGASLGSSINNIVIDKSEFNSNQNDGIYVRAAQSATVTCSSANNNAGYGVHTTAQVGSLTLESDLLNGNGSGAYSASGSPTIGNINCNPGNGGSNGQSNNQSSSGSTLYFATVNVTNAAVNTPDCTNHSGSNFVLPDGDLVMIPCTSGGWQVTLSDQPSARLPGALDSKFTFISGFSVTTTSPLTGSMVVSYPIPAGKEGSNFAILHWSGSAWANLGGTRGMPMLGYFGVETTLTGTFMLVTE